MVRAAFWLDRLREHARRARYDMMPAIDSAQRRALQPTAEKSPAATRLLAIAVAVWILTIVAVRAYCAAHGATLINWDAGWYADIASHGYRFDGNIAHQQSVAFLPAYPYVLRLLLAIGIDMATAMFVLSTAATVGGLALLHRTLSRVMSPMTSAWTCILFIASPFSLYLLNGYSESLYFLAACAFWWAMLARRDDGIAALFAGLSSLVRPFGVLLALCWVLEVVAQGRRNDTPWTRIAARLVALGPLALCGSLIVGLFYAVRFDDLFLYRNIRIAWLIDVVSNAPGETLDRVVAQARLLADWHPTLMLTMPPQLARVMLYAFVLTLPFVYRRLPRVLVVYGLGLIAFAIGVNEGGLDIGRHLVTNVALPAAVVVLLKPERRAGVRAYELRIGAIVALALASIAVQAYLAVLSFSFYWVS